MNLCDYYVTLVTQIKRSWQVDTRNLLRYCTRTVCTVRTFYGYFIPSFFILLFNFCFYFYILISIFDFLLQFSIKRLPLRFYLLSRLFSYIFLFLIYIFIFIFYFYFYFLFFIFYLLFSFLFLHFYLYFL